MKEKSCRKCQGYLRYEEDQWGGSPNCVLCGWDNMVWRVSENREDAILRYQNHTGQRNGFAVHTANLSSAVPTELRRKLQGGSESDQLEQLGLGGARA